MAQKLNALVLVSIQTPGSPDFEASLTRTLESTLPTAKSTELDRAAADYYFMRANWVSAEQCYRRCLEKDPSDVGAANNLALVIAEARSDFDEADRLIQQSLKSIEKSDSSPVEQSVLQDTQAQLLLAAGKTEAALEILTSLSQSVTADASVFLHLAECYHKQGRTDESQKAFAISEQLGIASSLLPPMDKRIYDNLATASTTQAGVEK
jgi:Flp pilus assembly protein TadD